MAVGDTKTAIVKLASDYNKPAWQSNTDYSLGTIVRPTTPNDHVYECTTAGTSGTTEPVWPTTEGATVQDGSVVWTCRIGRLDIRPPEGEEWIIHNIVHGASCELYKTDGTNRIKVDTSVGEGGWLNFNFHLTNSNWYSIKNISGDYAYFGYDGIQSK